jgi:uroporphyrinogen-III synthase
MTLLLLTRPEPAASKTAEKLARKGYSVTVLPLTRIVPLSIDRNLFDCPFDAVVATSANAIRHAPPRLLSSLKSVPAFAVGGRTAQAFRRHGFADVESAGGGAEALAALVARQARSNMRFAYLCGRIRTPVFEEQVGKSGVKLTAIETYDAEIIPYETGFLQETLAGEPFDAVLLYSARAAEAFADLLAGGQVESALFASTRFLCLSGKIAGALPGKWKERAESAATPEEGSLFDLLAKP